MFHACRLLFGAATLSLPLAAACWLVAADAPKDKPTPLPVVSPAEKATAIAAE